MRTATARTHHACQKSAGAEARDGREKPGRFVVAASEEAASSGESRTTGSDGQGVANEEEVAEERAAGTPLSDPRAGELGGDSTHTRRTQDTAGRQEDSGSSEADEPGAPGAARERRHQTIIAWGTLSTAIMTAVAAVAALWFTFVTTSDSHEVAQAQIRDSERATARESKEQAAKVNVWTNRELHRGRFGQLGPRYVFAENRSNDPVYMPVLYFYYSDNDRTDKFVFNIPRILPACTRIKLRMDYALMNLSRTRGEKEVRGYRPHASAGLGFFDSAGIAWDRFSGDFGKPPHLKKVKTLPSPKRGEALSTEWVLQEIEQADPKGVTRAAGCGDD
ncbi:MAG TPA: hypothetical protein VFP69_17555 [Streptomyces sp.]|nr:hypothetical protein [Streptomyces sp.]